MTIDYTESAPCGCGGFGHLESFVGGSNLEELFDTSVEELTDRQWRVIAKSMVKGLRSIGLAELGLPIVLG